MVFEARFPYCMANRGHWCRHFRHNVHFSFVLKNLDHVIVATNELAASVQQSIISFNASVLISA